MRTIIAGSRRITNPNIVEWAVHASGFTVTEVIEGGQRTYNGLRQPVGGVDYLAHLWALRKRIPCKRINAKWQIHGKAAGPIRNREMARLGEQLIAIPDSESTGTIDMIDAVREAGFTSARIFVYYDPDLFPEGPTGCLDDNDELSQAIKSPYSQPHKQ